MTMFKKGISGNPNGRPTGSPNKATEKIRDKINDFLSDNFETIKNDLMKLEPKERVKFYIDLLSFGVPKMRSMEIETDFQETTIVVIPPKFSETETGIN